MTKWRPPNWNNVFKGMPLIPQMAGEGVFETIFEAGADAMWEVFTQTTHCHVCMGELVATERAERMYCPRCRIDKWKGKGNDNLYPR